MRKSDLKPYLQIQENDDHLLFTECEDMYLQLKYNYVKKPSMGMHSSYLQLATKKSDGSKVLLKTIEKEYVIFYSFESTSPSELHGAEVSAIYGKYAGEKCMSPKSLNSVLPFEIEMQKYLSQDGYGSPHVPRVIDYVVTESTYVLVMEYPGEEWMALDEYTTEHGKFSADEVRFITKEVMTALLSLKNLGVAHGSVAGENVLYNKKTGGVKLMNFGFSGLLEGWNQGNSASGSSKDESDSWGFHSILGVENVYTWLRGGVLNGEADLDQRWLDGTVEHESMGTRHDNRMLAARLADFLQVAYRQYQSTLWRYHRDRLVEVG
ncbi:hypothetical protein BASA60_006023 [Batrachochytrium salamandrivorans]|nr:hypothetical protein BASA60_006023 [Batrachochytrium salamandrivorans]